MSQKAMLQPQGRRGQQLGTWDKVALFSLLVKLVFLHLLLSRQIIGNLGQDAQRAIFITLGLQRLLSLDIPGPDP